MTDPAMLIAATGQARMDLQAAALAAILATFYADYAGEGADVDAQAEQALDELTDAARRLVELVDRLEATS